MSDESIEIELEETEESSELEALPSPQYEIFSYPSDMTLKGYLEHWKEDRLFVPEFQRQYIWDQTRASKLIESFLLGLPVPPTFLYKPSNTKSFWIIDGHQRIMSIVNFQKGIFGDSKFKLRGVDQRWSGRSFEDLTDEDRFNLETSVLRAIVIQQTHPADHSSIYRIFERLNTGGVRLNAMEVRKCVYSSAFLTLINDLNETISWRKIVGTEHPDKRLKDQELILRVIALFDKHSSYEKPMKGFLNECAVKYSVFDSDSNQLTDISRRFTETCNQIVGKLGQRPFHLKGRLNFSALDAVVATLMKSGVPNDFESRFAQLVADENFLQDVSYNTSDESVLKRRFNTASRFLSDDRT